MFWTKVYILVQMMACVRYSACYPNGQSVDGACTDMTPQHHGVSRQTSVAPYQVSICPNWYKAGTTVTVTLVNSTSSSFKGFMLQARLVSGDTKSLGTFTTTSNSIYACSNTALVHNGSGDKSRVSFNWTAPTTTVGDLVFKATFVQSEHVFWTAVASEVLTDATRTNTTNANCTTLVDSIAAAPFSSVCAYCWTMVIVSCLAMLNY